MSEPVPFRYRAFLSYSHRDKAWGKWLQAALEGYRIDRDLAGRETLVGPVPKTLHPIFRDREDFSAGHSLTEQTIAALEASIPPMPRKATTSTKRCAASRRWAVLHASSR